MSMGSHLVEGGEHSRGKTALDHENTYPVGGQEGEWQRVMGEGYSG